MLGTFPKDFSQMETYQMATSQGYFPKWQLPKCAISQVATSQVCPSHSSWTPACVNHGAWPLSPS